LSSYVLFSGIVVRISHAYCHCGLITCWTLLLQLEDVPLVSYAGVTYLDKAIFEHEPTGQREQAWLLKSTR